MTDAPARRLAVVGDPIEHSLSPRLHLAAYRALGLGWSYQRVRVGRGGFEEFVAGLDESWLGLSVTMPLKPEAAAFGTPTELVRLTGAANTVLLGARPRVFNTDVIGVRGALDGIELAGGDLLLFGAGATAASVVAAVASMGGRRVVALVRDTARAAPLEDLAESLGVGLRIDTLDAAPRLDDEFRVAVNTIPALAGFDWLPPDRVMLHAPLLEVSYSPWPTTAAASWFRAGGSVIAGTEVLLRQAVAQVRIFVTGDETAALADEQRVVDAMRAALPVTVVGG